MKTEDRILELLKKESLLMIELQGELQVLTSELMGAMAFLEKYQLVETMVCGNHGLMARITPRGRQLLNLPKLPEDELSSNQLEVLEQHWGDEMGRALDQEVEASK